MAARLFPIVAGVGGAVAAGWTLRECARAGQTVAERCVPCAFAAGALASGAAIAYYNSEGYHEAVAESDRRQRERGEAGAAAIKRAEEERFLATTTGIMRTAEQRKAQADALDRYVDPRERP